MSGRGPVWVFEEPEKATLRNLAVSSNVSLPSSLFEQNVLASCDITMLGETFPKSFPLFPFLLSLRPHLVVEKHTASPEHAALTERLRQEDACRSLSAPTWARKDQPISFAGDVRAVNRQLTAILNMVLTVAAAFVFGFYGIAFAYPRIAGDMTLRAVLGLFFATVVFIADIYFVIKNMTLDEEIASRKQA